MFCWYYQWKISKLADENHAVLSHEVAEHLKRCEDCRQFYHLCRGMEQDQHKPLPIQPQTAAQIQQKIMQNLSLESSARVGKHRMRMVIAAVFLMLFPVAVAWMISVEMGRRIESEPTDVSGLTHLSMAVRDRWINDGAVINPAERYLAEPYQKQLREMTRSGKQAAAFMFGCLDAGLKISDVQSDTESTISQ